MLNVTFADAFLQQHIIGFNTSLTTPKLRNMKQKMLSYFDLMLIWEVLKLQIEGNKYIYIPPKENHLHMPPGEHFSNPCNLCKITTDLLDLLLCGDWVQFIIFVSI